MVTNSGFIWIIKILFLSVLWDYLVFSFPFCATALQKLEDGFWLKKDIPNSFYSSLDLASMGSEELALFFSFLFSTCWESLTPESSRVAKSQGENMFLIFHFSQMYSLEGAKQTHSGNSICWPFAVILPQHLSNAVWFHLCIPLFANSLFLFCLIIKNYFYLYFHFILTHFCLVHELSHLLALHMLLKGDFDRSPWDSVFSLVDYFCPDSPYPPDRLGSRYLLPKHFFM